MKDYQKEFIQLAMNCQALKFGEFTLKSGRVSPYFFNAGMFKTGGAIAKLGRFYAQAMIDANITFDMLLGPAYKGIPLSTAVSIAYADHHNRDLPFAYTRKEVKTHGEGGSLVGAELSGQVAIIDDVITAGTAVREVLSMIKKAGAEASAVVVGLNRQERGQGQKSAIQELEEQHNIPVVSIIKLNDIVAFLQQGSDNETDDDMLNRVKSYRDTYGVSD